MTRWRLKTLMGAAVSVAACAAGSMTVDEPKPALSRVVSSLEKLSRGHTDGHAEHWSSLLADAVAKDSYRCLPAVEAVLAPPDARSPTRRIEGQLPHYGWYYGPMRYRVGTSEDNGIPVWRVMLNIALVPSRLTGTVELPDCALRDRLIGEVVCEGVPYERAPGVEACPGSGRFEASAQRHNLRALMARWSRQAERYYNRDASYYGLPVRYDFEFFLADDSAATAQPVDLRAPLWMSCGRTPYFIAFRSGWSIPIVAHEVGHYLGLLDEYEPLSGVFSFYPKTPLSGSEDSRMGLSMKTHTRLLPIHHYLVLRRYHCPEPHSRDPFRGVLEPPAM